MADSVRGDSTSESGPSAGPDDDFLIAGMLGGDATALDKLIERYDRLVRYTVLRASHSHCMRDPHWLDTIASDTWTGFVHSMQRSPDNRPKSVRAYLVQIARNKCTSALRRTPPAHEPIGGREDGAMLDIAATTEEPAELLSRIELLEDLRSCLAELGPDEQKMASELTAITDRKWKEAAASLDMSESTLRSRWRRVLERLRRCITRKTGKTVARSEVVCDSSDGDRKSAP